MNQIIRELKAAANALRAASAEVDDISYILGWADGIDHAASILDDSDTSGPSGPHQKRDGSDAVVNVGSGSLTQREVAELFERHKASYLAHGY